MMTSWMLIIGIFIHVPKNIEFWYFVPNVIINIYATFSYVDFTIKIMYSFLFDIILKGELCITYVT